MNVDFFDFSDRVPLIVSMMTQCAVTFGVFFVYPGGSIYYKSFVILFSAFLFNLITTKFWLKLNFIRSASSLSKKSFFKLFFPGKLKSLIRLVISSFFTFVSLVCFFKSKWNNIITCSTFFIYSRLFVGILTNNDRSGNTGKIGIIISVCISLLLIIYIGKAQIIYSLISVISLFISQTYFKSVITSFHNEAAAVPPLLLLASGFSLLFAPFIEHFQFDFNLIKTIIGGPLTYLTPSFFLCIRKNINSIYSSFAFVPVFISAFLSEDRSQLITLVFLSIFIFASCNALNFSTVDIAFTRPLASIKSFFFSLLAFIIIFGSIWQFGCSALYGQIWRISDASFLLFCMKWVLSELFQTIKQNNNSHYSFGFRRISHILGLSLSVVVYFLDLLVFQKFIQKSKISFSPIGTNIPSLISHIGLSLFFVFSPRNKKASSVVNAVNFHSSLNKNRGSSKPSLPHIVDLLGILISVTGFLIKDSILDKLLALLTAILATFATIPVMSESIRAFLQSMPLNNEDPISVLKTELEAMPFVDSISDFHVWQNDDALNVSTLKIDIDGKKQQNPQEFLMDVIMRSQKAGIFDVTAELASINAE